MSPGPSRFSVLALLRRTGHFLVSLPVPVAGAAAVLWASLIWFSSSTPIEPGDPNLLFRVLANLTHAPLFGILALFLAAAVAPRPVAAGAATGEAPGPVIGPRWRIVLLVVLVYGIVDELHQSRTPSRSPSALDVATDVVGGACVLWIIAYLGSPAATNAGLARRLLAGVAACTAVAFWGAV